MKLPVPAADERNSGDSERHPGIGCFTYIAPNLQKNSFVSNHGRSYPQPPRAILQHLPWEELLFPASLRCCEVTWLADDPGRQLELLRHLLGGKQEGKCSQKRQAGQSLSWQSFPAFKGRAWEQAAGGKQIAEGRYAKRVRLCCIGIPQILSFCALCVGWGSLEMFSYGRVFLQLSVSCPQR